MHSIVKHPVANMNSFSAEVANLSPETLLVVHTEGYDFDGESFFVMSVQDVLNAGKGEISEFNEVLACASHWCLLSEIPFVDGNLKVYEDNGGTVLIKYMNYGHVYYGEMKLSAFLPENQLCEDGDGMLPSQNVLAYYILS